MLALDTSVALPLLLTTHPAHEHVVDWWAGRRAVLSGHALAQTYSVLTRLPGDVRFAAADAVRVIEARFGDPLVLAAQSAAALPRILADLGIDGGAVYDAMVALTAREHSAELATRDMRAKDTYDKVGVDVVVVA